MIHVKKSVKYYINERSLTFSENDLDDPQRVAVSLVSGTVIMVRVPGVIDYASDGNFERWTLKGYSTKLVNNALHYVYARLSRTDRTALVVFSLKNYNIDGSITTVTGKDESGNDVTETTDPSTDYFYIKIGELTATDGKSERELTYDSGLLGTEQGNEESSPLNEMWELSKLSTPWLIRAKQWLYSFTVKGFITLIGGLVFRKGEEEKSVNDIKRSGDSDTDVPVSDDTLPTTRYVSDRIGELDGKFLRKDQDDRTEHSLEVGGDVSVEGGVSSEKGFRAGTYVPGATGAACYQDEQGAWHIETDHLKVRRKFTASEVEIQTTHHVGGQQMLSAASMTVDYVYDAGSFFRCYFLKKDTDGTVVGNEWKPMDQAFCNTFNIEVQPDGSVGNHYLWRRVEATSNETEDDAEQRVFGETVISTADYHFVDLSRSLCAAGSDVPKVGDRIVHLGYQGTDDPDRQNAIVIAGAGAGSPYIYQFTGIGTVPFELPEPETRIKPGDNRFSGMMEIKAGSTGIKNLSDFPDELYKSVVVGASNLLMNSGFVGNYKSEMLNDSYTVELNSELYSNPLKFWDGDASILDESESISGKCAEIGKISQHVTLIDGESYVVSFKAKGVDVCVSCGSYNICQSLTDEYQRYVFRFSHDGDNVFSVYGSAKICDLKLERGTIATDWSENPNDSDKSLAEIQSLSYIKDSIINGSTDIIGGLILTSMIKLGNYKDGLMQTVNAGISGIYNEDSDVAYWAGGSFENAVYAVLKYAENPSYQPSEEELADMAKFVCTHGGRAILNDVILRGYIYALGGYFKGEINAEKGIFRNVSSPNGNFRIDEDGLVEFLGGNIGSFIVDGRYMGIKADGETSLGYQSVMALLASCITFNGTDIRAAIGSSVRPPSTGVTALGEFKYTESRILPNYGLLFDIANSSTGNYAFCGKGNGVLGGMICGYGVQYIETSPNTVHIIGSLDKGNNIVVKVSGINSGLGLPNLSVVRKALDIKDGDFCVPLNIVSQGTINIYGKNSTVDGMDSEEYPTYTTSGMSAGGRIVYLIYTKGEYSAYNA